jgi:AcrR family transcriptional regulator
VHTPQAEEGRTRILAAAVEVFSSYGFEGASLRQIADAAGVQHQLVVYHFKTKDALWREAVASFFARSEEFLAKAQEVLDIRGPASALRFLIKQLALFTAAHPQFHRIVTFEGRSSNERLKWVMKNFTQPHHDTWAKVIAAAQRAGVARKGDPGQLHYAVIGLVTTSFVFAPEYRAVTGLEPFHPAQVEKTIALACDFMGVG